MVRRFCKSGIDPHDGGARPPSPGCSEPAPVTDPFLMVSALPHAPLVPPSKVQVKGAA